MGKDAFLAVLSDPLSLDAVHHTFFIENTRNPLQTVREYMQVDVGTVANVAG